MSEASIDPSGWSCIRVIRFHVAPLRRDQIMFAQYAHGDGWMDMGTCSSKPCFVLHLDVRVVQVVSLFGQFSWTL